MEENETAKTIKFCNTTLNAVCRAIASIRCCAFKLSAQDYANWTQLIYNHHKNSTHLIKTHLFFMAAIDSLDNLSVYTYQDSF